MFVVGSTARICPASEGGTSGQVFVNGSQHASVFPPKGAQMGTRRHVCGRQSLSFVEAISHLSSSFIISGGQQLSEQKRKRKRKKGNLWRCTAMISATIPKERDASPLLQAHSTELSLGVTVCLPMSFAAAPSARINAAKSVAWPARLVVTLIKVRVKVRGIAVTLLIAAPPAVNVRLGVAARFPMPLATAPVALDATAAAATAAAASTAVSATATAVAASSGRRFSSSFCFRWTAS
jgi:hypothetical protein